MFNLKKIFSKNTTSTRISIQKSFCPYCKTKIDPPPTTSKKCTHCEKKYFVRTFPENRERRIIRKEDIPILEALWVKHRYAREAGEDLHLTEFIFPIDKLISEAKKAYRNGDKKKSLSLYTGAIKDRVADIMRIKEKNKETWKGELSGWWELYRSLAIYYMAEENYTSAISSILKSAILDMADSINFKKKLEQAIPPVTIEIIKEGIDLGKINKLEFQKILRTAIKIADNHIKDAQKREPDYVKEISGTQSIDKDKTEKEFLTFFY